jgi:hypothetical protein
MLEDKNDVEGRQSMIKYKLREIRELWLQHMVKEKKRWGLTLISTYILPNMPRTSSYKDFAKRI